MVVTGSVIVSGSNGGGVFSKNGTLADLTNGISNSGSYIVWYAPFPASVQKVIGRREGGTAAEVNAFRSSSTGFSPHLSANLSLTNTSEWFDGGAVQNQAYIAGNSLFVHISGSAGNDQIAVQVDFVRTL